MPNPAPPPRPRRPPRGAPAARPMRAWLERETRLALATRALRAQLADPDAWTDHRGRRHAIEAMSPDEARVVMRLLRRRARGLHRGAVAEYLLAPYPHREHPQARRRRRPPAARRHRPADVAARHAADARAHRPRAHPMTTTPERSPTT